MIGGKGNSQVLALVCVVLRIWLPCTIRSPASLLRSRHVRAR